MKLYYTIIVYLIAVLMTIAAQGKQPSIDQVSTITYIAKKYDIDANKMLKIAWVESKFSQTAVRHNKNNTVDVGVFQINSIHFSTTCKDLDVFVLKGNAECAARLIKIHKSQKSTDPQWLSRYHSKTPSLKAKYSKKLELAPDFTKVLVAHTDK